MANKSEHKTAHKESTKRIKMDQNFYMRYDDRRRVTSKNDRIEVTTNYGTWTLPNLTVVTNTTLLVHEVTPLPVYNKESQDRVQFRQRHSSNSI